MPKWRVKFTLISFTSFSGLATEVFDRQKISWPVFVETLDLIHTTISIAENRPKVNQTPNFPSNC